MLAAAVASNRKNFPLKTTPQLQEQNCNEASSGESQCIIYKVYSPCTANNTAAMDKQTDRQTDRQRDKKVNNIKLSL